MSIKLPIWTILGIGVLLGLSNTCKAGLPAVGESADLLDFLVKKVKGQVRAKSFFDDKGGRHLLLLSRDSAKLANGSDKISLHATQFISSGLRWTEEWSINDNLTCPELDIDADFILPLTTFSDLDSNGIRETTIAYHLSCQGGIDSKPTKAIMRQGKSKFAARGESLVQIAGAAPFGGTFTLEPSLDKLPPFKMFLTNIWKKAAGVVPMDK